MPNKEDFQKAKQRAPESAVNNIAERGARVIQEFNLVY